MILAFCDVLIALCVLLAVRNELTHWHLTRVGKITSALAQEDTAAGRRDWIRHYHAEDAYGSYNELMFDLRKWTFAQFFPGIESGRA